MLLLLFYLGEDRYALDSSAVLEVLPRVELRRLAQAPPYVAGLFLRGGQSLPVIDLRMLVHGSPCNGLLSSRVIVVQLRGAGGDEYRLGLVAERVTETVRKEPRDLVPPGIRVAEAPYLGPLITDAGGMIQCIELDRLLPPAARASLFTAEGA